MKGNNSTTEKSERLSDKSALEKQWNSINWKQAEEYVTALWRDKILEPYEGKLSRTVLRGGNSSNVVLLPDHYTEKSCLYKSIEEDFIKSIRINNDSFRL